MCFKESSCNGTDLLHLKWSNLSYKIKLSDLFQIYFTRNGNVIGKKDIRIPKGGFYPTVGMMSCDEKVRVDLRPLSG